MQVDFFPSSESLQDFRLWLEAHDKSANTCRVYLCAVRQFYTLYQDVSHENLLLYKCYLLDHYKPQTVNLRIRAMNAYMEYQKQPSTKLSMVRIQHKLYAENVISQADYEYLKGCLLRDGQMIYYFAVRIMAATGLRVGELVQLQAEDVQKGYRDVYSKGNRMRRIYLPKTVQEPCWQWLEDSKRTTGHVFLNRFGNPITATGIRDQLKQLAYRYNLNPTVVYPHTFRHLFAKNFIEHCDDIAMLSDILGHESIETTRIYLHRSSTEQKQIFNQIVNW